jgi:soluble lytic murein transglycosylase-like protein
LISGLLLAAIAIQLAPMDLVSLPEEELDRMIRERARQILRGAAGGGAVQPPTAGREQPVVSAPARPAVAPATVEPRESLQELARRLAGEIGVPVHLAFGLIQVESAWNPQALSNRDARGLAQVLPSTAREIGFSCDLFEAECSLRAGFTYLRSLLEMFGDPRLALAGYNAGPGVFGKSYSRETRESILRYVRQVIQAANKALEEL